MMWDSVLDRTRGFSPKCTDRLCGQPTFLFSRNHDASLTGQAAGGEPGHSPPSSTEVKSVEQYVLKLENVCRVQHFWLVLSYCL
jgi:hypothetical protein